MSRIVPKLNLNKTPQLVENNSLVMAKNIRLLEDGTIGPDTSLEEIENKSGDSNEYTIHHDAVIQEKTSYEYTILDFQSTISVIRDGNTLNPDTIVNNAFDFNEYGNEEEGHETGPNRFKYVRMHPDYPCHIHCYKHVGEEIELVQERFSYSTNHNALITSSGYWLFIAIREEIYNNTQEPTNDLKKFYYVVLPQSYNNFVNGSPQIINIRKFNYVILNPVYQTSTIEEIVIHEAYDEQVVQYNTPKYIGQIVGLDNKIYFFREDIAVQYSDDVRSAISEKYPNEKFVWEDKISDKEATFDVNSENYVTRKGELFEDRDVAEEVFSDFNNRARIIEYDEVENTFTRVKCAWHYSGGKINGCVTVNNSGEYILTICEYNVPNNKLVPIKHINLAKCNFNDDESFYTQAPNIPITNLLLDGRYVKNIPAGVYQFFIRYKIHDNFYTNWFPCSKELFAGTSRITDTLQGSIKHVDLHLDSNNSFVFKVEHLYPKFCSKFEQYQIGFIISSDGGIFARSWKHFNMTSSNDSKIYFEYNKEDIEEINIDDLLKVNYDIFNVGNIASYKNRLYISNYEETDFNEDLGNYARQINIKFKIADILVNSGYNYYFNNLPMHEIGTSSVYDSFGEYAIKDTFRETNYCDIIKDPVEQTIIGPSTIDLLGNDDEERLEYLNNLYHPVITKLYIIDNNNTNRYIHGSSLTEATVNLPQSFDDHVVIDTVIDDIKDKIIGIDSNGVYKITIDNTDYDLMKYSIEYKTYSFGDIYYEEEDLGQGIERVYKCDVTTYKYKITETISLKSYIITTNYIDTFKEYNTLLPFTKYDFYIHYVKQNGIITNGYYIGTKEMTRYSKGYNPILNPPAGVQFTQLTSVDELDDMCFYNSEHKNYAYYDNPDTGITEWYELVEDTTGKCIIYPIFDNIKYPPGYVGCFISISKYGYNVAQGFNYTHGTGKETDKLDCLELDSLLYNKIDNITIRNSQGVDIVNNAIYHSSSSTNPVSKLGGAGHVEFQTPDTIIGKVWILFDSLNKPYNKTLTKLTPYIPFNVSNSTSYSKYNDLNSPGYFCRVKKLNREYCDSPDGYYISANDIYTRDTQSATNLTLDIYDEEGVYHDSPTNYILSNFNLNYVSLTNDLTPTVRRYNKKSVTSSGETVEESDNQIITLVDSIICSFILELKSMFRDYTRRQFYEYTKNKLTKFDNTIRVSAVDVDEIYRYIYRFEATDYYNVPMQRGIITNLISIANSIYVHCEHSLFKFSDNKTLNAESEEVTLQENDIFNSGITEVFDAQYGYAGLKKREQSLITYNAYIFYDEVAKTVYAFGGEQQIGNISEPIKKLIKAINPTDVQFLGDEPHNRFFINFRNNLGNVCISFNFNSKSFVSIHDIDFKFGFHSRRHSYVVRENTYDNQVTGWSIYKIIDVLRTELIRTDQPMPPDPSSFTYVNNYIAYQNCYKKSLIHISDCDDNTILNEVNSANACVDIICNTEYEAIKVLNYISWICSEIIQYGQEQNNVSEELIDRHYPAHKIRIYSDSTETSLFELLDSNGNPKIANENSQYFDNEHQRANSRAWQYPQYNCGVWSMNYFRDVRNIEDVFDYKNTANEIIGEEGHETSVDLTPKITRQNLTQENSLLYGKYFVVRFIFNNKNFKLENLILRMNDYGKTK